MNLFRLYKSHLEEIKNVPFKLEKEIQELMEKNLDTLFGLEFVKSEFQLNNLRIDTLGFDQQTKSFVIIEYKKGKNYSVIDQGYSYLSLLLNNKADFILEYLERTGKSLKKDDIDWSQSRVFFISPQFTTYQKQSIEFKDLPFELWEISRYSNDTVILNQHKSTSQESVKSITSSNSRTEQVSREIVVYTEEDHLKKIPEDIKELYEEVKSRIVELGDVDVTFSKFVVSFRVGRKVFSDLEIQQKQIKQRLNLKKGSLDDPKKWFVDVSKIGHWGVGDYQVKYKNDVDIDYLMSLVKQSYNFHKKR